MGAVRAAEIELCLEQARADRNAEACPRREALSRELSGAIKAMHGRAFSEARYRGLRIWLDLLRSTDSEIDPETERKVRVLL